jgi:hypothetical protein
MNELKFENVSNWVYSDKEIELVKRRMKEVFENESYYR